MPFSVESANIIGSNDGRHWIDSHCHFDFDNFDSDRESHWGLLQKFGCTGLIIPGVRAETWDHLIALCEGKPWGYGLGLHPYFLDQHQEGDLQRLENTCREQMPKIKNMSKQASNLIAIGEFGLDLMLAESGHKQQAELCRQQFLIAEKLNLPVILHIRKAYDEVAAMIRRLGFSQGGIVHAFSGSYQQGMALVSLGFKLGIGGAMSHPRAKKLRGTIARLPLASLVLETDAPDMKPAFWQGPDNSPLSLLILAQIVASLHSCHLDEVLLLSNNNVLTAMPNVKRIISRH
ncbi:MAG: TatD family hydrolase [Oleispira sp.]|nr:TatD family hydrolase [Oleispira sp.]MBL4880788.1 TatD family hydrolase [Oleispira sp.]